MPKSSAFFRAKKKFDRSVMLWTKHVIQTMHAARHANLQKGVTFVAGVQRSGTNMLMDVLERSYDTDVYHERDSRAFEAYEMRARPEIHGLVKSSKARLVIIKALCELQDVKALIDEFAPAKALWIVRRFEDVVNSHLALWNGMPRSIAAIVADRNAAGWRGRGMSEETHSLVRRLYHSELSNASACALFWYFRNILYFEQGLDRDDRVHLLRYESLVRDPASQFSKAFSFLGLQYSDRYVDGVFSGSVRKRSAPDIEPAVRELCESLAQRFEKLFDPS